VNHHDQLYQTFKEQIPILLKIIQNIEEERILADSFYEATIILITKAKTLNKVSIIFSKIRYKRNIP
jgi:hypothetical protein